MNRLQTERRRLYLVGPANSPGPGPGPDADADPNAAPSDLVDAQGRARALVLELARPAEWDLLAKVWHGVQGDLDLPAPAIAVSGVDGLALWFSLAQAVSVTQAQAFLAALVGRYLPDVAPLRLSLWPARDAASAAGAVLHARPVPAPQAQTGHWSVFVAPDLAPVFADTPWLDSPPSDDGQARLLRGLACITPAAWAAAQAQLGVPAAAQPADHALKPGVNANPANPANAASPANPANPAGAADPGPSGLPQGTDPRQFLLAVMNDNSVALALRIDAAKALLPYRV